MTELDAERPPPLPHRPWIVRAFGPKPAPTLAAKLREIVRRTAWLMLAEFGAILALDAAGVNVGNAGQEEIKELLGKGLLHALFIGAVFAPVLEELFCRGIPSFLSDVVLRRKDGGRWMLGILMAAAFALLHNLSRTDGENMIQLGSHVWFYLSIPISQFMVGLLQWDFVRRYGLWACILSHALHNLVFLTIAFYGPQTP